MLLKLGILGGRAHHHTSFLGLLKFCDLLHIWNTSWMLKSRKCERNNLWMNYSCFSGVGFRSGKVWAPRLGKGEKFSIYQTQWTVVFEVLQTFSLFGKKEFV